MSRATAGNARMETNAFVRIPNHPAMCGCTVPVIVRDCQESNDRSPLPYGSRRADSPVRDGLSRPTMFPTTSIQVVGKRIAPDDLPPRAGVDALIGPSSAFACPSREACVTYHPPSLGAG